MKDICNNFLKTQIDSQHESFVTWMGNQFEALNQSEESVRHFSFHDVVYHNPENNQSGDYLWNFKLELAEGTNFESSRCIEFSLKLSEGYLNSNPGIFGSYKWISEAVKAAFKDCNLSLNKPVLKVLQSVVCAYIMHLQRVKVQIEFTAEVESFAKKSTSPVFAVMPFEYVLCPF